MSTQRLVDPWQRVHEGLRSAIFAGELEPGVRLLETSIAERYAVSRGPVREALRALEVEGLVVREPRIGSMVVPIDHRSAEELYSLRMLLEPFAARRALERRPASLIGRLSAALADMRQATAEAIRSSVIEPDIEFHTAFFREADHEHLLRMWESMKGPLKILISMSSYRAGEEWAANVLEHESIVVAASAGDVDRCVAELERHLTKAQTLVIAEFSTHPEPRR